MDKLYCRVCRKKLKTDIVAHYQSKHPKVLDQAWGVRSAVGGQKNKGKPKSAEHRLRQSESMKATLRRKKNERK